MNPIWNGLSEKGPEKSIISDKGESNDQRNTYSIYNRYFYRL